MVTFPHSNLRPQGPRSYQWGHAQIFISTAIFALFVFGFSNSLRAQNTTINEDDSIHTSLIAGDTLDYKTGPLRTGNSGPGWNTDWVTSRLLPPTIVPSPTDERSVADRLGKIHELQINGTAGRNNPLRRALLRPIDLEEVFVAFEIKYLDQTQSTSDISDPEFFVLWLDRSDGGDQATHAGNIPNFGIHLADRGPMKGQNVFMVRISPQQTAWSQIPLQHNRGYRVVGRLSKSELGQRAEYDRFDLWVDPNVNSIDQPDATLSNAPSLSAIRWLGFSTGIKTEPSDEIRVRNLVISTKWEDVLNADAVRRACEPLETAQQRNWDHEVDFGTEVLPLLRRKCFDCHAGDLPESGYRLDRRAEILGYSTGETLAEPFRSHKSRLVHAITTEYTEGRMPPDPDESLSQEEIDLIRAWIDQGLSWDFEQLPNPQLTSEHWAFQPLRPVTVPTHSTDPLLRHPIDLWIDQEQRQRGLRFSPRADLATLARRVHFDLTGLPPTTAQVARLIQDPSPDAWERWIDSILASPQYGEHWARFWLDLARWAESQGYQHDIARPHAWRYRDYVISSFNEDRPYPEFLKQQIAGDEIRPYSDENLIATGFLAAGRISGNQEDPRIQRNDMLVDIVNAIGSAVFGLTLECAQCHNHKFDPISQRDYYRLQAYFVQGQPGNLFLNSSPREPKSRLQQRLSKSSFEFYQKEAAALEKRKLYAKTEKPLTWGFLSASTGHPNIERQFTVNRRPMLWIPAALKQTEGQMLIRGDANSPGPVVAPGWPEVLGHPPDNPSPFPRSELADWLGSADHPLAARVWVNRVWQQHFGQGIVATASNFGLAGEPPTHPELLDWLANEFIESGWSTKHLHRLILTSRTYQQKRQYSENLAAIDPNNQFLWTWPRRRLSAEAIRDSMLSASAELDLSLGGTHLPRDTEQHALRRTIYLFQQRSHMPMIQQMFDGPTSIASCSRRSVSTVALQPLYLLNSDFVLQRARALAQTIYEQAGSNAYLQIHLAFGKILGREPQPQELVFAIELMELPSHGDPRSIENGDVPALVSLCHALFNLNEFTYIP
jgi:hypothetical protein